MVGQAISFGRLVMFTIGTGGKTVTTNDIVATIGNRIRPKNRIISQVFPAIKSDTTTTAVSYDINPDGQITLNIHPTTIKNINLSFYVTCIYTL